MLQEFADRRARHCSGGVRRRLNLAIALLQQPDVLLLDEPTVGVDPQSRAFLLDQVRELVRAGTAVLYATHYMEEVSAVCSHILLLDHGRVLASGDLATLLRGPAGGRRSTTSRRCSCTTPSARCANECMPCITRRSTRCPHWPSRSGGLLLRNPHGLAVLFLMPALFVLVMSFTLKNTLTAGVELPTTGWVLEDSGGPAAAQWAGEWLAAQRRANARLARRAAEALRRAACRRASSSRRTGWTHNGQPRSRAVELWLSNRIQPAAAGRLRAELSLSMLQVQMQDAAAAPPAPSPASCSRARPAPMLPAPGRRRSATCTRSNPGGR